VELWLPYCETPMLTAAVVSRADALDVAQLSFPEFVDASTLGEMLATPCAIVQTR
jgi:hypothetical protein